MRALVLLRRPRGGAAALASMLPDLMDQQGIEVVVDDAAWIPNKTGQPIDKEVAKTLKAAAQGFDLVHALDYRSAWACAEAFYVRFPWVFSALGMTKTTDSDLIDRLNCAKSIMVSSKALFAQLDGVDTIPLEHLPPCVAPFKDIPDRSVAKGLVGFDPDSRWVLGIGESTQSKGWSDLGASADAVRAEVPDARFALLTWGDAPMTEGFDATVDAWVEDVSLWIAACDLLAVPSHSASFSRVGAEAMLANRPVLMRRAAGLAEQGGSLGAHRFEPTESPATAIVDAFSSPYATETVANAGRVWAESRLDPASFAGKLARVYRDAVGS